MWSNRHDHARMVRRTAAAMLMTAALAGGGVALAQDDEGIMPGFDVDSDEPIRIESDSLEVRDRDHRAIFSGNVVAEQGDTILRTRTLTVFYTGSMEASTGGPSPDSAQTIERLEAQGKVVVERLDQKATGDWAIFEVDTQMVTLGGDVVLTQGGNVVRGQKLLVNLDTGVSHLVAEEGSERGGRVQGLFIPGSMRQRQE